MRYTVIISSNIIDILSRRSQKDQHANPNLKEHEGQCKKSFIL